VHLSGIGHDFSERRRKVGDQLNILAQQAMPHVERIVNDGGEVERLGLRDLLAAESQKLLREFGRAGAGLANLVNLDAEGSPDSSLRKMMSL
jgi:hypothetical protein